MPDRLPPHLADWAALPGPAKVIKAVRTRAEAGHSTVKGSLACTLDDSERKDVGRLLGNRWVVSGRSVRLQDLAAALPGLSPLELAERVGGKVTVRAEQRAAQTAEAEALRASARLALTGAGIDPDVIGSWLAENGRYLDLAGLVADVWRALPAEPIQLATLAARTCQNAHALDDDQPVGRAVARLAAAVHGLERPSRSGPAWRAAWRAINVLCNEVSSRVLVLNLRLTGPAAAAALSTATPGEPVWLTLRSLSGVWRPAFSETVYVCENPTIVEAAADRLGATCPPLVCTDGTASAAALDLISRLANAGCEIRARADFDRAGLVIVEQTRSVAPQLTPWRFDLDTYRQALGSESMTDLADLAAACVTQPIHEEALLPALLDDLSQHNITEQPDES